MENAEIDYLSFVRGFTAALDGAGSSASPEPPDADVDPHSYAEGVAAGSQPVEHTLIYRELSIRDEGRFTGTLDLSGVEADSDLHGVAGPWQEPLGQSRTEAPPPLAPFTVAEPREVVDPPHDDRVHLSGTLELG
ncbi:hypothetical protein ACWGRK_03490 [Saccharomonospora azurea]|uniref:hypothetical protein n=1 Tax=Saccharomonospora azurea TaxID=40988 RepID=UPI003D926F04